MKNRLEKNIYLDYIYSFLANLNMSSSIWVLYLAYRGMNLAQVGILEGIFHVTSVICEIPSGAAADLLGRKKSMIAGRICLALSCIIMLFSNHFSGFAAAFVMQAWGYNFNSGSEEALVYDSMKLCGKESQYLKVSGRLNVLIEIAQAAATVMGGILAEYSYIWCYAASCVIALLCLVPAFMMTEPEKEHNSQAAQKGIIKSTAGHFKTSWKILRSDKAIRKVLFSFSAVFAVYTVLFFYSQQYFYDLGLNKIQISLIMLAAGVSSCLGAFGSQKIYGLLKNKTIYAATFVIGLCLIGFRIRCLSLSVVLFMGAALANALLYPVQSISLNSLIPSEQRATIISVDSLLFSLTMVLLFPAAGAFASRWGLYRVFEILGLLILCMAGLLLFYGKKTSGTKSSEME